MKTVWKYEIQIKEVQSIPMQEGARIIHVGVDPMGKHCVWAEVNTYVREVPKTLYVYGTGHNVGDFVRHLGSFVDGSFVWHVYEQD